MYDTKSLSDCCAERSCENPRAWTLSHDDVGKFCSLRESSPSATDIYPYRPLTSMADTCRAERCQAYVDKLAIFCNIREAFEPSHCNTRLTAQPDGCSKPKCHQETIAETLCIDRKPAP